MQSSMGKPLKQTLLQFTVKSLTVNFELIHVLNHLGHIVSYTKLEEVGTDRKFAEVIIA